MGMGTRLHNYKEVGEYLKKGHPDWLRVLTPRHTSTRQPTIGRRKSWPSHPHAAMQNYVSILVAVCGYAVS
jgi:hypothetical protein